MKKVIVLMATYNGENYLRQQIESIINQKDVTASLWVHDDGSTDNTCAILEEYASNNMLKWYTTESLGAAQSFLDLIRTVEEADYYAFCDQDDVWDDDKLAVSIAKLADVDGKNPAMYFSSQHLVDEKLQPIGFKRVNKVYTFAQVLICNNVTGCTVVFNNALRELVNAYRPKQIMMHDQWLYLVCLAHDGVIICDGDSHIRYRQHANNAIGAMKGPIAIFKRRLTQLIKPSHERKHQAGEIVKGYAKSMRPEYVKIAQNVAEYDLSFYNWCSLLKAKEIRFNELSKDLITLIAITVCSL